MCAWYVVFIGKQPDVYTSWAECSEHVLGVCGAVHKKYSSYAKAMVAFNSTINSMSSSKPFSSLSVTENGATTSPMSYRNVTIFFLCALVAMMWMRLNRCNSC
jgi:viroplasmin and RNaseH domain-containing protein